MKPVITATIKDRKGRIIARERNSYSKTHPIQAFFAKHTDKPNAIYLHAEMAALLACGKKKPFSIHVERYKRDGSPGTAMPCAACSKAIKAWGVKQVSFTLG